MSDADKIDRLNFALNYLRLPLAIDPTISNLDTERLLAAFSISLHLDPNDPNIKNPHDPCDPCDQ